ncbi:hypothetical protein M885DRAFT_545736 [Pelagophyceae sp. CCMP2097]|nr:hypothetical protein M885DRAFT_545736 [Pelagophyceae sp. CCMP2097]
MMSRRLALLALLLQGAAAAADDAAEEPAQRTVSGHVGHRLTDIPPPGDFVTATAFLIGSNKTRSRKWVVGGSATVLCHFKHRLAEAVRVTGVQGSLNNVKEYKYHLQNFSYDGEAHDSAVGEDLTLDYTFDLADHLDAGEWRVAATVFYNVGDSAYATTFFNETVTLEHPPASTAQSMAWFAAFAAMVAGTYYLFTVFRPPTVAHEKPEDRAAKARADAAIKADQISLAANDASWTEFMEPPKKPAKKAAGAEARPKPKKAVSK